MHDPDINYNNTGDLDFFVHSSAMLKIVINDHI